MKVWSVKDQIFNPDNPTPSEVSRGGEPSLAGKPPTAADSPIASESDVELKGHGLDLGAFLGFLAGETNEVHEGERDIVASAIRSALDLCDWHQLPSLSRLLLSHAGEIDARAERIGKNTLSVRGQTGQLPLLALCATIQSNGFVETDERQARALVFLALVDLAAHSQASLRGTAFKNLCAGLRVLIQRLSMRPRPGTDTTRICVWQLFDWISGHADFADYAKAAYRSLQDNFVVAWRADGETRACGEDHQSFADDEDIPIFDGIHGCIWALAPASRYESALPEELSRNLLSAGLTRITTASRYTRASLLLRSPSEMTKVVSGLLSQLEQISSHNVQALTYLLSIASCTDLRRVGEIRWASEYGMDQVPPYPGVLTPDGRWLVRSELDPRAYSDEARKGIRFRPKAVHIPIPAKLAELLVQKRDGHWAGKPVLPPSILATPVTREGSAWQTTITATLMRDRRFGISSAQQVMHTSFGMDTAPLFYDRIPASHLAHLVARTTHPWFGEKPRPPATNMPSHDIGSQRVVEMEDVREFLAGLRQPWSEDLELWQRIRFRSPNLAAGLLISIAGRYGQAFCDLSLSITCEEKGLLTITDKKVAIDQPGRLGVIGSKVLVELRRYLCDLREATVKYAGTPLGTMAARILSGSEPLLIVVDSPSSVRRFGLDDLRRLSPNGAVEISNWARQCTLDLLSTRTTESIRAAIAGWTGTRTGAISELSTASPVQVLKQAKAAIDGVLDHCKWRPLPGHRDPKPAQSRPWPHWLASESLHVDRFRQDRRRLERSIKHARVEFAETVAPAVNAYFRAIRFELKATAQGLEKTGSADPPELTRQHQREMLNAMMSVGGNTTLARELLHDWLAKARDSGFVSGPLPRQIHRSLPDRASPFVPEAARALAHREGIRTALFDSSLPIEARTFLMVMLDGWVPDAELIVQLMKAGARLHDLPKGDVLLIHPVPSEDSSHPGCLAFRDAPAIALRAWHRGKHACEVDLDVIGKQIHGALSAVLSPSVTAESVVQELEALMRANHALRAPGIMRDVAIRRVIPAFAPIDRIVAMEENQPISPRERTHAAGGKTLVGGIRKARKPSAFDDYERIKEVLRTFKHRWSPSRDIETRNDAIASLHALIPEQGATTGVHLIALYAASYVVLGINKEHVRPVTVSDAVSSVGAALIGAIPEQFDVRSQAGWQAVYARAIDKAPQNQRQRLAGDLAHFQTIMVRDHSLPAVEIFALLDALDVPSPTEKVGFFTPAEQAASLAIATSRVGYTAARGTPEVQRLALRVQAIIAASHSSCIRNREFRLPLITDWCRDGGFAPHLRLRSNGLDFVKSAAGRRAVCLAGPHSELAIASIDRLVQLAACDSESARQKLFVPTEAMSDHGLEEAMALINSDLRYVTGNALSGIELTRKTWALNSYRNLVESSVDLWPVRELLAEMGQARMATMQGYYLHNPLAFLDKMPRDTALKPIEAGWLLGMSPKAARELLNRRAAWLWRSTWNPEICNSTECALMQEFGQGSFEPCLRDAEQLTLLLAAGASPRSALATMAWPQDLEPRLIRCLDQLASAGVALEDADRCWKLAPPARAHSNAGFEGMRSDAAAWHSLAWIFSTWLGDWRARDEDGFSASDADWQRFVGASASLAGMVWSCEREGHLIAYRVASNKPNGHSPWPTMRWMSFAAWIRQELVST